MGYTRALHPKVYGFPSPPPSLSFSIPIQHNYDVTPYSDSESAPAPAPVDYKCLDGGVRRLRARPQLLCLFADTPRDAGTKMDLVFPPG